MNVSSVKNRILAVKRNEIRTTMENSTTLVSWYVLNAPPKACRIPIVKSMAQILSNLSVNSAALSLHGSVGEIHIFVTLVIQSKIMEII